MIMLKFGGSSRMNESIWVQLQGNMLPENIQHGEKGRFMHMDFSDINQFYPICLLTYRSHRSSTVNLTV